MVAHSTQINIHKHRSKFWVRDSFPTYLQSIQSKIFTLARSYSFLNRPISLPSRFQISDSPSMVTHQIWILHHSSINIERSVDTQLSASILYSRSGCPSLDRELLRIVKCESKILNSWNVQPLNPICASLRINRTSQKTLESEAKYYRLSPSCEG